MQRESALITEDVERIAVCVLGSSSVVLPLIEESPGFLAFEGVEMELHAVHRKCGCGLLSVHKAGASGWKGFEFSDARIDSLDNGRRTESTDKFRDDSFTYGVGVNRLGQDLQRENVVVAVDDQARD